ncbi:MAG: hypothetical protein V2I46_09570 [Bacteroides sp.]|nr:hypothetical protein [Bacteroides sp.]
MAFRKGIHRNILWILIPMVLALYYNQAANWHLHVLNNGLVVEHAHPYQKDQIPGTPYQQHQHSAFEYFALAQKSNLVTLLVVVAALLFFFPVRPFLRAILPSPPYFKQFHGSLSLLRAPPPIL